MSGAETAAVYSTFCLGGASILLAGGANIRKKLVKHVVEPAQLPTNATEAFQNGSVLNAIEGEPLCGRVSLEDKNGIQEARAEYSDGCLLIVHDGGDRKPLLAVSQGCEVNVHANTLTISQPASQPRMVRLKLPDPRSAERWAARMRQECSEPVECLLARVLTDRELERKLCQDVRDSEAVLTMRHKSQEETEEVVEEIKKRLPEEIEKKIRKQVEEKINWLEEQHRGMQAMLARLDDAKDTKVKDGKRSRGLVEASGKPGKVFSCSNPSEAAGALNKITAELNRIQADAEVLSARSRQNEDEVGCLLAGGVEAAAPPPMVYAAAPTVYADAPTVYAAPPVAAAPPSTSAADQALIQRLELDKAELMEKFAKAEIDVASGNAALHEAAEERVRLQTQIETERARSSELVSLQAQVDGQQGQQALIHRLSAEKEQLEERLGQYTRALEEAQEAMQRSQGDARAVESLEAHLKAKEEAIAALQANLENQSRMLIEKDAVIGNMQVGADTTATLASNLEGQSKLLEHKDTVIESLKVDRKNMQVLAETLQDEVARLKNELKSVPTADTGDSHKIIELESCMAQTQQELGRTHQALTDLQISGATRTQEEQARTEREQGLRLKVEQDLAQSRHDLATLQQEISHLQQSGMQQLDDEQQLRLKAEKELSVQRGAVLDLQHALEQQQAKATGVTAEQLDHERLQQQQQLALLEKERINAEHRKLESESNEQQVRVQLAEMELEYRKIQEQLEAHQARELSLQRVVQEHAQKDAHIQEQEQQITALTRRMDQLQVEKQQQDPQFRERLKQLETLLTDERQRSKELDSLLESARGKEKEALEQLQLELEKQVDQRQRQVSEGHPSAIYANPPYVTPSLTSSGNNSYMVPSLHGGGGRSSGTSPVNSHKPPSSPMIPARMTPGNAFNGGSFNFPTMDSGARPQVTTARLPAAASVRLAPPVATSPHLQVHAPSPGAPQGCYAQPQAMGSFGVPKGHAHAAPMSTRTMAQPLSTRARLNVPQAMPPQYRYS